MARDLPRVWLAEPNTEDQIVGLPAERGLDVSCEPPQSTAKARSLGSWDRTRSPGSTDTFGFAPEWSVMAQLSRSASPAIWCIPRVHGTNRKGGSDEGRTDALAAGPMPASQDRGRVYRAQGRRDRA